MQGAQHLRRRAFTGLYSSIEPLLGAGKHLTYNCYAQFYSVVTVKTINCLSAFCVLR